MAWRTAETADAAIQALIDNHAKSAVGPVAVGPRLSELEGYGSAKVWGMELAADLKLMQTGKLSWADIDHKGLLLSGPPGTGKTTFAMALANEAGVPLVATSVADWTRAEHLGITQQKMKKAFTDAMEKAPSILFIDELDGIADRGTLRGHNAEYWTHVINSLLELLAGVEGRDGVVVLGASNHPDKIDGAIRRSGRLDRHIEIGLPDIPALEQILRYHLKDDLKQVSLKQILPSLIGMSGADAEAIVRRARGASRRLGKPMSYDEFVGACSHGAPSFNASERRQICVHEAGHTLVSRLLHFEVECVSMTLTGGMTRVNSTVDGLVKMQRVIDVIVLTLAGRAAEEHVYGPTNVVGGGAEGDLQKSTELAIMLETRMGGGIFGPVHLASSDHNAFLMIPEIRHSVAKRMMECHERALVLIRANAASLLSLAKELDAKSYLDAGQIEAAIAKGQAAPGTKVRTVRAKGGSNVA